MQQIAYYPASNGLADRAYYPASNGLADRFMQSVKMAGWYKFESEIV